MSPKASALALAVAALFLLAGCGSDSSQTPADQPHQEPSPTAQEPGGAHPSEGPHGGHLIVLGNEAYHAELLHDEQTHTVTVHLLDATGKQPVSAPQTEITVQLFQGREFVSYPLKAVPRPGDAGGTASEFHVVDEALCDALSHEDEVQGRLQVTVEGKSFTGNIEHTGHDPQGHVH